MWFDFDIEAGQINKAAFFEVVKLIRIKEGIEDFKGSPFRQENLDKMFSAELQADYEDENTEDLEAGHIWHYGVVCLLHDVMKAYAGSMVQT